MKRGRLAIFVDVDFTESPESRQVGMAVSWAFIRLCSYSKRHLTDGLIPHVVARDLGADTAALEAMTEVGWVTVGSQYVSITAWAEWNDLKGQIKAKNEQRAERNRRYHEKIAAARAAAKTRDLALSTSELEDRDRDRDRDRGVASQDRLKTRLTPDSPTSNGQPREPGAIARIIHATQRADDIFRNGEPPQ